MQEETYNRGGHTKKPLRKVSFAPGVTLFSSNRSDDDEDEDYNAVISQRKQLLGAMRDVLKDKGPSSSLPRAERLSIVSFPRTEDTVSDEVRADLLDYKFISPDAVCAGATALETDSEGPLRFIAARDRAPPPQWMRRWSDLFLFRNTTGNFTNLGGDAHSAAVEQLAGDVTKAQAQNDEAQAKSAEAQAKSAKEAQAKSAEEAQAKSAEEAQGRSAEEAQGKSAEEVSDVSGGDGSGSFCAADLPLWRRPGARATLTRRLAAFLGDQLSALRSEARHFREWFIGAPDLGGADGTQRNGQCPLLQRVHAGVMAGAVLDDACMQTDLVSGDRARNIDYSYRKQTPRVHAEFVIEKYATTAYDPMCIGTLPAHEDFAKSPCSSTPLVSSAAPAECRQAAQSVFTLRIEYVRFQPPGDLAAQKQRDGTSVCARAGLPVPMSSIEHQRRHQSYGENALVVFSPEEELISRILDNYEPYRMVQLDLAPGVKSRRFYQHQLSRLQNEPHHTKDLQKLITTLSKLYRETSKLECYYTRAMLNAWKDIATLRGESASPVVHTALQTIDSDVTAGISPALSIEAAPKLLDNTPGKAVRFQWYLSPHGEAVSAANGTEDDLVDYVPVVEGADVLLTGDGHPLFQVLVFARTSAMVPPQFIGATTPRALSVAKVLFINETFELRGTQEPQDIILHVVPASDSMKHWVISSVIVPPTRKLVHRLLPFGAPVTFTYRGRVRSPQPGNAVNGVVSLTTTWTAIQEKALEETENIFLRGDADPLDPQHEALLGVLRKLYTEKNSAAGVSAPSPKKREIQSHDDIGNKDDNGNINTNSSHHHHHHDHHPPTSVVSSHRERKESERMALLRRRWLVRLGRATPRDASEEELFAYPLPLDETECRKHREAAAKGFEDADAVKGSAPTRRWLSRSAKLERWQQKLRADVAQRRPTRRQEDHELLERFVAMPRLRKPKFRPITPKRQLNPRRESQPKTGDINRDALLSRQNSRILVHIMKASSLPQRVDGTPLEPFVEVNFVYETVHSRTDVGVSPAWFETLEIPFCPPDFDNETLSIIEDDIVISLYDKVEIQMAPTTVTNGAVAHETHYRTERRLLGTLHIPFFSLYEAEQARMEGQYALETPRWILGYQPVGPHTSSPASLPGRRAHLKADAKVNTTAYPSLQLHIALSPPLRRDERRQLDHTTVSRLVTQLNVSPQLQLLHGIAVRWRRTAISKVKGLSSVNPIAKQREIEPFALGTSGDLTLVCRYLIANGGPPPPEVRSPQEAIRFVSLLPFRIDGVTWGDEDVWSTNVELLCKQAGDYEELSFLLAHFLRYLKPDEVTMVVTGRGTVHHHTVMVLHSFGGELRLIDPRTGKVCPVHDPHIPTFHDVHMVISHNQMWANVQLSGAPHRMGWNLQDKRLWFPCFDQSDEDIQACLPFIAPLQCETLPFKPPDANRVAEIEQQLREAVRKSLFVWRNNQKAAFHHGVASILCELLKEAERERCEHASVLQEKVTKMAGDLINEHFGEEVVQKYSRRASLRRTSCVQEYHGTCMRLMGCPVNDAYRPDDPDYQAILQRVFKTAVHEIGTSCVSFAIGVYVKGYTSDVYSMWVFLAALHEVAAPTPSHLQRR